MWTETTRPKYERSGLRYVSDLTDAEWKVIGSLLPARKRLGRPRTTEMREVVIADNGGSDADSRADLGQLLARTRWVTGLI